MSDIGDWLNGLGLGQFAELFRDNLIDLDVLPDLTEADLATLGLPLGARKKILKAACSLESSLCSVEALDPPAQQGSAAPPPTAERRQLTLMFVDLVGSTALAERLDPEEMGAVLRGFQNCVAGEITRLEGHVAKYMGDGILAYFGFPSAHEDDAERAVRAGLAIVQALAAARPAGDAPLSVRIGIATGLVVVGDLVGEGAAQEQTVVGETPNLAARLQGIAAPGQVVVAEATRRLLGDLFELEDLGSLSLKGITGQVAAFVVRAERPIESRFEARQGGILGAIVGREHELSLMLERWRRARDGEGQVVLLTGEAGIGKSRLTRGLIDALGPDQHVRISYQCSPYHADSALHPAIVQLTRAAGLAPNDSAELQLDKLERLLAKAQVDVRSAAPLMATLLGLPFEQRYGALDLRPEQLRARTLQMLVDQLVGLAGQGPVLFVVEDAHWIDPTTLEGLDLCLDSIAATRVMLLVTARPVFRHGFGGHPIVTSLALNRLGRDDTAAIVSRLTGGKRLPGELLAEIAAKTDGVPLFIEELTKTALESGMLRETADAFVLDRPLSELAIPTSLHDSLMARLDRMQPVKEVAQTAACIGREFDHRLVVAIASQPESDVKAALERLAEAELIFRRGLPPDASYLFKHALVRDAAYESLLKSKRQAVHQRILAALETSGAQPQLLGHHAKEAGLIEQAIVHYEAAGRQALAKPAYLEAIASFRQARGLLKALCDEKLARKRNLELQVAIGQACIGGFGHGADETASAFQRALEMLHEIGESPLWLPIYYGRWVGRYVRADLHDAVQLATEMTARAAGEADDAARLIAHRALGATLTIMGRTGEALDHLERAWQLYDPARHRSLAGPVGQEPGVTILCYQAPALSQRGFLDRSEPGVAILVSQALALLQRGFLDRSRQLLDDVIVMARETGHPLTIAFGLGHASLFYGILEDFEAGSRLNSEALTFTEANGIKIFQAIALGWLAQPLAAAGRHEEAIEADERARPLFESTGTQLYMPQLALGGRLPSLIALGRYAICEADLRAVMARIESGGELWMASEAQRCAGNLAQARGETAAAERRYCQAIEIASQQEARLFELRASRDLAGLWAQRGERQQALDFLAPVYSWFTEGFDTADVSAARQLLDELA